MVERANSKRGLANHDSSCGCRGRGYGNQSRRCGLNGRPSADTYDNRYSPPDTQPYAHAYAHAYAYTHAYAYAHANPNTNPHADADPNANALTDADSYARLQRRTIPELDVAILRRWLAGRDCGGSGGA